MHKILAGFICASLLFNILPVIETMNEYSNNFDTSDNNSSTLTSYVEDSVVCSEPILSSHGKYCSIKLDEATTYTRNAGQPILPVVTKTYSFPIGTIISHVFFFPGNVSKMSVEKEIGYTTHLAVSHSTTTPIETERDKCIYSSSDFYPHFWYNYHIGVGLDGINRVTYLTIQWYPVRYAPQQHTIQYIQQADIQIQLQSPMHPAAFMDAYDLLIIAPQSFESHLQRLVNHKENMGVKTNLVTTEDIYATYEGRDQQEQIKYCIQHAIEEWNITYVLLVGGMKGQQYWKWYIPTRISHVQPIWENETEEWIRPPFMSDLYYADIYQYDDGIGYSFDDWDADGDGVFSEWNSSTNKDIMDLYPDVYLGRLPCRYLQDVDTVVDRIITYETTTYGQEWFRRMAVVGGDTHMDEDYGCNNGFEEGKLATEIAISYMSDFEHARVYTDGDGDIDLTSENLIEVMNQGQGFFFYSGHGSPTSIATHPHGDDSIWIGITNADIKTLKNRDRLPIYIMSACENCQFNVSILSFLKFLTYGYDSSIWRETAPYCLGELLVRVASGGAIAVMGFTALGWNGVCDENNDGICDAVQYFDEWLHLRYFYVYNQSIDVLGQVFGQSVTDYLQQFPLDWYSWFNTPSQYQSPYDCAVVQYNVLFGDPSLKIGGYP